jgi:hypothetical protein
MQEWLGEYYISIYIYSSHYLAQQQLPPTWPQLTIIQSSARPPARPKPLKILPSSRCPPACPPKTLEDISFVALPARPPVTSQCRAESFGHNRSRFECFCESSPVWMFDIFHLTFTFESKVSETRKWMSIDIYNFCFECHFDVTCLVVRVVSICNVPIDMWFFSTQVTLLLPYQNKSYVVDNMWALGHFSHF